MSQVEKATFAGGCFWCMIKPFDQYSGVISVISGYTGGHVINPTYKQVCAGDTGHVEAVEISFNPDIISYNELLDIFWQQIDPTDSQGQFVDRGDSYRPAIFYHSETQKEQAIESKLNLEKSGRFNQPIAVSIEPAKAFYPAEDYHQDFYQKQPEHYEKYRKASGRDNFISKYWQNKK
jgi:methionine-S-sulfoxide reductase